MTNAHWPLVYYTISVAPHNIASFECQWNAVHRSVGPKLIIEDQETNQRLHQHCGWDEKLEASA